MSAVLRCRSALLVAVVLACKPATHDGGGRVPQAITAVPAVVAHARAGAATAAAYGPPGAVTNHFAYIPPQCYAKLATAPGKRVRNPCYTCHTDSTPSNYVRDADLQLTRSLPRGALKNLWSNLSNPAAARVANLEQARAGDDYGENDEVRQRFFDQQGAVRPAAIAQLHEDVSWLLLPSPARALALDRAYLATVREPSFVRGREPVLSAMRNLIAEAALDERTGLRTAVRYR